MALPVMQTFVTGEIVTATKLNTNVRDAINFLLSPPLFIGRRNAAQPLSANNDTGIQWDVEELDADGMHTGTNATVTPLTPGVYDLEGHVAFAANATGTRLIQLFINGSLGNGFPVDSKNAASSGATYTSTASSYAFNGTTDNVQLVANSSQALNVTSARLVVAWRRS